MKKFIALTLINMLMTTFWRPPSAGAEQISVDSISVRGNLFGAAAGVDYQNRNFISGDMEYDLNYWGLILRPSVRLTDRWTVFLRLGYSRLVFDRPEFGATDYDEWGFEYGGGVNFLLFRWKILKAFLEGECSYLATERRVSEGTERGNLLQWRAGGEAGADISVVYPYVGFEYNDARLTHEYSTPERDFSHHYEPRDRWKTFAGVRVAIPPFTAIQGRYYFGKDMLMDVSLGLSF
ncbi:MAG: hypothetical protein V1789_06220 [PVC group bacterium]